jgi:hypothetical protein
MEPLQPSRLPADVRMASAKLQGRADRWTLGEFGSSDVTHNG